MKRRREAGAARACGECGRHVWNGVEAAQGQWCSWACPDSGWLSLTAPCPSEATTGWCGPGARTTGRHRAPGSWRRGPGVFSCRIDPSCRPAPAPPRGCGWLSCRYLPPDPRCRFHARDGPPARSGDVVIVRLGPASPRARSGSERLATGALRAPACLFSWDPKAWRRNVVDSESARKGTVVPKKRT